MSWFMHETIVPLGKELDTAPLVGHYGEWRQNDQCLKHMRKHSMTSLVEHLEV